MDTHGTLKRHIMAILVTARIVSREGSKVTYLFSDENGRNGYFSINCKTGELALTKPMPNDSRKTHFARAARRVILDWKETGTLPPQTVWSS